MKLDPIIKDAIQDACVNEEVPEASGAITRLIERFVSNELPEVQISSTLQGIYELLKGK